MVLERNPEKQKKKTTDQSGENHTQSTRDAKSSNLSPGGRFSKAPETFRERKAMFTSSVSKNGEVYMPETSCMG